MTASSPVIPDKPGRSDRLGQGSSLPEEARLGRNRRASRSAGMAIAARLGAMSLSFVSVPILIGYLGVERYGLYASIAALTTMFAFTDLGVGSGLVNLLASAMGRDDRDAAVKAVSTAFVVVTAIAMTLAVILFVAFSLDIGSFFQARDPAVRFEANLTAIVLFICFVLGVPLGLVERVRLGYQEAFFNSGAALIGAVLSFVGLLIALLLGFGLPLLAVCVTLPPLLALAGNGVHLFARRTWLWPRLRLADAGTAKRLARLGILFFVLQLAGAVAYQSDVVVAGAALGPEAAALYSVTLKVFLLGPTLIATVLSVLWPAYAEAIARGDMDWVRATLRRTVIWSFLGSAAVSIALAGVGQWLIGAWTRGAVSPPPALLLGAALWAITYSTFNAVSIFLNGAGVVALQIVLALTMSAASLGLSILFAARFGVSGIIWGTLLAYLAISGIPLLVKLPYVMRDVERRAWRSGEADSTHE